MSDEGKGAPPTGNAPRDEHWLASSGHFSLADLPEQIRAKIRAKLASGARGIIGPVWGSIGGCLPYVDRWDYETVTEFECSRCGQLIERKHKILPRGIVLVAIGCRCDGLRLHLTEAAGPILFLSLKPTD